MVDVERGWSAVEVERHMAGRVGMVAVFGVQGAVFECGKGFDLNILGNGFAGGMMLVCYSTGKRGKGEASRIPGFGCNHGLESTVA